MASIPQTSGIYKITCIANGKIYVGSTKNLRERWCGHRKALRRGNHHSIHLQNAWNKYGEPAFEFEIIELVMPWSRIDREQYWLDTLKPYNRKNGFNIAKIAEPFGEPQIFTPERKAKVSEKMKGNKHASGRRMSDEERAERSKAVVYREFTSEHKAKISAAKMGHIVTVEMRENMRKSHLGEKQTPERVLNNILSNSEEWIVTDPNGTEFRIKGLALFCRERGLSNSHMASVAKGRLRHHKQWKCRKV
jgi:group I intron endonuclease